MIPAASRDPAGRGADASSRPGERVEASGVGARAIEIVPRTASGSSRAPGGAIGRAPRYGRLLEVLPGFVTWLLILLPVALSVVFPQLVAWFVLSFDFYWLFKA
ncbi:MAG: hypothetical protein M3301_03830, partial [Chloroflexota bacterium]|nr:hypothetical protein [Chloroflexota bacterium]